ncbi:MAG: TonB-dependent receptor, partial [Pedobacter sp.]
MPKYLLVIILCFAHLIGFSQNTDKKISTNLVDVPLKTIIDEFEKQSGYKFYYNAAQLTKLATAVFDNIPLTKALDSVLKPTDLGYTIDEQKNVFVYSGNPILLNTSVNQPNASKNISFDDLKIDTGFLANRKYTVIGKAINAVPKEVVLSGYIFRVSTKMPVANAVIRVDNAPANARTDANGYFNLKILTGKHDVFVTTSGLKEEMLLLEVNAPGNVNIGLNEKVVSLREVTINSTTKRNVEQVAMGVERMDIKRIKKIPSVFGEPDVLKVLLTLPGVKTTGEASAGFNVRGGASDQNLILFNNMTIYNPTHFLGFFSAFNSEIIKDLELYKSSIPAKYGGRLSSVLEINGIEGDTAKIRGSAGIGLITSRINIDGPIVKNKTTFVFGARATYSDWLLNVLPGNASFKNSSVSFYDANLSLMHKIDNKNSLNLSAYLSHDDFKLDSDTINKYTNKNLNVGWKHVFNNDFNSNLSFGYDGYTYNVESNQKPLESFLLDYGVDQFNGKLIFTKMVGSKNQLNFGLDAKLYKVKPGNLQPLNGESLYTPVDIEPEQALESAVFLSDKIDLSKKLSLDLGVRYSFYNYLGPKNVNIYADGLPRNEFNLIRTESYGSGKSVQTYSMPEVRASARYSILDNLSVKASYNTLAQYMHLLSNTTTVTPTDVWKLSDNNIKPQKGSQISFGIYQNANKNAIEISAEVYYKKIKDYLDYKSGAQIILNKTIETEVLKTEGKAYGAEFMIKKNSGRFNGWFSYTFSRTFLKTNDPVGGELINKGEFYPSNYDKPHDM